MGFSSLSDNEEGFLDEPERFAPMYVASGYWFWIRDSADRLSFCWVSPVIILSM